MKIEIWSDVMCPFCYIGKRKFEKALTNFNSQGQVQVIWKSFLLQPDLKFKPGRNIYDFLSETKGLSADQARAMTQQVSKMAGQEGLELNFDKVIVANSIDAHRLIHLASSQNLQNQAAERFFSAHFVEGKNIQDHQTLLEISSEIGLEPKSVQEVLASEKFMDQVNSDVREAQNLRINGVPFFVFNRKFAVSGAQPTEVFLEVLQKVKKEESDIQEVSKNQ